LSIRQKPIARAGGLDRAAGGEQRRFPAGLGGDGVVVEQSRDLERLQPLQVGRVVAALDLLAGRGCAFGRVEALEQDGEPLSRLDVRLRRMQLGELRVAD
jgi:hypothetical protein